MTEKLYEIDSHMSFFDAKVISCEKSDNGYSIILDKTAFFPEEGGQPCDTGNIDGSRISGVSIKNGVISHTCERCFEVGSTIHGIIDWEKRFCNMQSHSGEHIVSGLIYRKYGYDNVGFHIGSEDVTLDLNGTLTRAQLDEIEDMANEAVYKNVAVTAEYPAPSVLAGMKYRSKLELKENVRIVTIEGYDVCACCAPHVKRTGEIGIIKLLDFQSYKSGIRIHMQCGRAAVADYRRKYASVAAISAALSAKQPEISAAVDRLLGESNDRARRINALTDSYIAELADKAQIVNGNILSFIDILGEAASPNELRSYAARALDRCSGICAVFSGSDENGYSYAIASAEDVSKVNKAMTAALNGRGGGRGGFAQGTLKANRVDIENYFGS